MKEFLFEKKKLLDYLPFILVPLLFIADEEMEHHAFKTSFQFGIVITTSIIFFIIFFRFRSKAIAFSCALVLWMILQYVKSKF